MRLDATTYGVEHTPTNREIPNTFHLSTARARRDTEPSRFAGGDRTLDDVSEITYEIK